MSALNHDARRLFELAKGSSEPPRLMKARVRERLDTKLAALTTLGAAGFTTKVSLAVASVPASKTLLVSLVLVGAASVGYATAPRLHNHATPPSSSLALATQSAHSARNEASHAGPMASTARIDPGSGAPSERTAGSEAKNVVPAAVGPVQPLLRATNADARRNQATLEPARDIELEPAEDHAPRIESPHHETVNASEPAEHRLADETRLIRQAHQEILHGRAETALTLLSEHQQRFPTGMLQQEREAARIVATCRLGRQPQAWQLWVTFSSTWPNSTFGDRVRASCHWVVDK